MSGCAHCSDTQARSWPPSPGSWRVSWLAPRWLQHPVGFGTALALESLTQAIRHFIFVVPAGLGVQEAGLVGFGYLLGLGNDASIALSLAKRMREILFGVPALAYWQLA